MNKALAQASETINELGAELEAAKEQITSTSASLFISRADDMIARHGGDFREELGEGVYWDMEPGSPEAKNRTRLYEEMETILNVRAFRKQRQPITERQLLDAALASLFGSKVRQKAKDAAKDTLEKRRGQFVRRAPGAGERKTEVKSPDRVGKIREKMRDLDMI